MTRIVLPVLCLAFAVGAAVGAAQPADPAEIEARAGKLAAEQSYALAHAAYEELEKLPLPPRRKRWLQVRLADTAWRAGGSDRAPAERARMALQALVDQGQREEGADPARDGADDGGATERDRTWAEAAESLGDYYWLRSDGPSSAGLSYYALALRYWAGSTDLALARSRYLELVRRVSAPPWGTPTYYYGYYGTLAFDVAEGFQKLAQTEEERAFGHYLAAMTLVHGGGDPELLQKVPEEFAAAVAPGARFPWRDTALWSGARYLAHQGRLTLDDQGNWRQQPDYPAALAIFRRLVAEYKEGESQWHRQAVSEIESIERPSLEASVPGLYKPGTLPEIHLATRNLQRVDLALHRVDLASDLAPKAGEGAGDASALAQRFDLGRAKVVRRWIHETGDAGLHVPASQLVRMQDKLGPGAYVLAAKQGALAARDLLLVTDAVLTVKSAGGRGLGWLTEAGSGAPIGGARFRVWQRRDSSSDAEWVATDGETGRDGLVRFDLLPGGSAELVAVASKGEQQALCFARTQGRREGDEQLRITAFTDRPAYRPGDTAQWKLLARAWNGFAYRTPRGEPLDWEVTDPRGSKAFGGKAELDDFGAAWGSFTLGAALPLGEYTVHFSHRGRRVGSATLLRLEEYKLPELTVTVQTPREDGRPRTFRPGERVEAEIKVEHTFGGPVGGAEVEVLVHQTAHYPRVRPVRAYPWFYDDLYPAGYAGWGGGVVHREKLKTDAGGIARTRFQTPRGGQDYEYRIEARVTDSSRREVSGQDTIRVTRQRFRVQLEARHAVQRPKDLVSIDATALDANEQPVSAEATVTISRERWDERWRDPAGREVSGKELAQLKKRGRFPPAPGWRQTFRGYQHELLERRSVKTDAAGRAEIEFRAETEGTYRFAWSSLEKGRSPIVAEATVFVASPSTADLGWQNEGLQLLVDRDTFEVGDTARVLVASPEPDRWVLLTAEAEELHDVQVVHVQGAVQLVELPIRAEHAPNLFLSALSVHDGALLRADRQLVVPPVGQFLQVDVRLDRELYQPREEAAITVTARDRGGRPVAAQLSVGLVDESVYAIQKEYAQDPRQAFYGTKRSHSLPTASTLDWRRFAEPEPPPASEGEPDGGGPPPPPMPQFAMPAPAPEAAMELAGASKSFDLAPRPREAPSAVPASRASMGGPAPGASGGAVVVRSDFRATAFFQAAVQTDATGQAVVRAKLPESLTRWRATARAASREAHFGFATAQVRTRQPLMVRLQAPRFFVEGDELTLSAIANNASGGPLEVAAELQAEGGPLQILGPLAGGRLQQVPVAAQTIPAGGEHRFDWRARVVGSGPVRLRATSRADDLADGMELPFVAHAHGIEKLLVVAGRVRGDEAAFPIDLPPRRPGSTRLAVHLASSPAVLLLDALPYLVEYPYGCTEQTMSRFLPAVVVARTLEKLGLDAGQAMGRALSSGGRPAPGGAGASNLAQLDQVVQAGLARLYDFQRPDGAWGWWKVGEPDPFMTAYVLWGLGLAEEAGVLVKPGVVARAVGFLDKRLVDETAQPDRRAWLLHALSAQAARARRAASPAEARAFDELYKGRERLAPLPRALLLLSAIQLKRLDAAKVLASNLQNGAQRDKADDASKLLGGKGAGFSAGTVHWGQSSGWTRWSDGAVESTAWALKALVAYDPQHELAEPAMSWLVKNRRGARWSNTRDTALTVLALSDWLRRSGALAEDSAYRLSVNGKVVAERKVPKAELLSAPSRIDVDPSLLRDGRNEVRLERLQGAPLAFSAEAGFFSLEEPIQPAGSEIFVRRRYFKWVGRPSLLQGWKTFRQPLRDGEQVKSGERVEVVVTLEAKNDYEYLLLEDQKPAGFEAVEQTSGQTAQARELKAGSLARSLDDQPLEGHLDYTGRSHAVHQELRDRKVALFVDRVEQGLWELRYNLRAEVPGQFHALPLLGQAMYVPEVRANGDELRVEVVDR